MQPLIQKHDRHSIRRPFTTAVTTPAWNAMQNGSLYNVLLCDKCVSCNVVLDTSSTVFNWTTSTEELGSSALYRLWPLSFCCVHLKQPYEFSQPLVFWTLFSYVTVVSEHQATWELLLSCHVLSLIYLSFDSANFLMAISGLTCVHALRCMSGCVFACFDILHVHHTVFTISLSSHPPPATSCYIWLHFC